MMVSFVLSFFPRDVLDEILNLIESVSEDFPSYSYTNMYAGLVLSAFSLFAWVFYDSQEKIVDKAESQLAGCTIMSLGRNSHRLARLLSVTCYRRGSNVLSFQLSIIITPSRNRFADKITLSMNTWALFEQIIGHKALLMYKRCAIHILLV